MKPKGTNREKKRKNFEKKIFPLSIKRLNPNECTMKERQTVRCPQNGLSKYASETSVFRWSLCCTDDDEDLVLILNIFKILIINLVTFSQLLDSANFRTVDLRTDCDQRKCVV